MRISIFRYFFAALVCHALTAARAEEAAVQLLLPSRVLEAKSTFELRFASEMVGPDQVGKPAAVSPLVFQPAVGGRFVWLSTRSGSFAPDWVLPLGTKFQITVRPGLKDAAGKDVPATLREPVETPAFRVKGASAIDSTQGNSASVLGRYVVLFNANVDPAAAAKFCSFVDAAGNRIAARVERNDPAKTKYPFRRWQSDDKSITVWGEDVAGTPSDEEESSEEADPAAPPAKPQPVRANELFIAPVKPLPVGKNWCLILEPGLPAAQWNVALPARKEIAYGSVLPFEATRVSAESNRADGRRLIVDFSRQVADDLTSESLARWITIEPKPPNLRAEISSDQVTWRGDFGVAVPYRVTVKQGLPGHEPGVTEKPFTKQVTFGKFPPRLYFQNFAAHQAAGGSREVRLVSTNVPRVRIAAKRFTGAAIPAALKAYDKYQERPEEAPDNEMYQRVDPATLIGEEIWHRDFAPAGQADVDQTITLNWAEIIGEHRTGTVLLTAESIDPVLPKAKRVGTQTLLQLTDLGAVWKRDRAGTSLHVFSLATGKGIPSAQLRLLNQESEELATSLTDAAGNAHLDKIDDARWVFVKTEADAHVISLTDGENALPLYRLGVTESSDADDAAAESIFLFTERGVYKPRDTVHLKGFAQDPRDNQPRIPTGKQLKITVTDAKEREIAAADVTLSDYGSFDHDITLPDGSLGKYRINAVGDAGEQLGGSCYFQVQEYRPNAFEIVIPPPLPSIGSTQLDLPITAKYFTGAPLTKAKLTWSLVGRDQRFTPEGLSGFVFTNGIDDFRLNRALGRISQLNAQGDLAIDATGATRLTTALPVNSKAPQPRAAKLLCEVTDQNQQTVSESRAFVQHSSEFYFGLRRFDNVLTEKQPLPVELIAVRPDGKPLEQSVHATVRLSRINWQTNRIATAGDTSEFEAKPQLQMLWERDLATAAGAGEDRKPARALLADAMTDQPGEYLLEAAGKDVQEHDVLTSMVFEVSGEADTSWDYRNPYVIDLITDKDTYEPGETATLLVKTPIAGDALVTIERDRVMRSFIVPVTGNAPSIQVPIDRDDGPNVFVSVIILRGANESPRKIKVPEYRIGYANLKVARPKQKLTVGVRPANRTALPGTQVQVDVEVRDVAGAAAADAEVTLYAVDEGVLSLTGYETPDALAFFDQPRGLGVSTSLTLPTLLREDAPESDFANKGYLIGDGKGGPALLNGLRKNFLACAFWNGTLKTDRNGRVHAEFDAPDSLTRYRLIAVAATKQAQLGAGESAFEVNKPIMIESAMPTFANVGDKLVLRAVAHNTTDFGGKAEVYLKIDGAVEAAETMRRFSFAAHSSLPIDIPVQITGDGEATIEWAVKFVATDGSAQLWDNVEAKMKLNHPAPSIRQVETERIDADRAEILHIADPQILEGTGEVTVNLSNSRVVQLREALRQLLEYPYGCVEQTTSSLLPWLTVRDLRMRLPELAKSDEEISSAVDSGVRLLLSMQTSGGGLAYWPKGREPMLWGTAYGGIALTLAKKQGFAVPDAEYKRLLKYTSEQLRGMSRDVTGYGLSDRCLAVYSLAIAGVAEPAYHDLLFQKRAKLSAEDRAILALAVIESKGPKQMIDELLRGPAVDASYVEQWFGSLARENAVHLFAWTLHQPKSPRVDQLATELFARRVNGHWTTTQGNAWSLLALASYLRQAENGRREANGSVTWGTTTNRFAVSDVAPTATSTLPIEPKVSRLPLTLTKTGGPVFTEISVDARAKLVEQPRQQQGHSLNRRYQKFDNEGRLSAAENLRVGDRVLITLDVETDRRATYVALEDRLPSVLAPINPAFKSQEVSAGESLGTEWVSDYHELREDRAVFFVDLLNPGRYTLRYLARVVSAGESIAPSAKIEEMYHPERFGTTEMLRVSAQSLE
ncbi:MAG: alpha-2-macroglobulin [Chthoniobacterales bacterium]